MFVRQKRNRSGSISVHIISKARGRYHVVKTLGSSRDPAQIERLVAEAHASVAGTSQQQRLFPVLTKEHAAIAGFIRTLDNAAVRTIGPEYIFGTLFDRVGYNAVEELLFRHLVVARLAYPKSKLQTADYLQRYRGIDIDVNDIYRFLDTLNAVHKKTVEKIAFEHTRKIIETITVVFYDMTTLYFEAEEEDDFRKIGFSKDGKFQCPQIMIGLLVGEGGHPIGYDVFEGNTFEGHTLVATLDAIAAKYRLGKPVVVADAAMLSKKNLADLVAAEYTFIVGGRIKNENDSVKAEILEKSHEKKEGLSLEVRRTDGTRLIVTHSEKRSRKDKRNREKGIERLRRKVASGNLTKAHITNRGYNKFLVLDTQVSVTIDERKIADDALWDGLKGYVTNTTLPHEKIVEHYGHLWQIEKAFRVSKSDLRVRPIFHRKRRRIEAHLCIAFVAYSLWKELERLLKQRNVHMTPTRAAALTQTMYALEYALPGGVNSDFVVLKMQPEQQILSDAVHGRVSQ